MFCLHQTQSELVKHTTDGRKKSLRNVSFYLDKPFCNAAFEPLKNNLYANSAITKH